ILAPTIGPTLGGWITDNFSWHWVFLINAPVALLSLALVGLVIVEPEALERERKARWGQGLRLDVIGFGLAAVGLGALELTMDRGNRDDWFSSPTICLSAALALIGIVAFVIREFLVDDPLLDLRLLKNRNFAICAGLIL